MTQEEIEDLANNHSVDDNVWSKESFIQGYNKSQKTHPYSEEDMIEFLKWKENNYYVFTSDGFAKIGVTGFKSIKELIQMWREQQPNIINIK